FLHLDAGHPSAGRRRRARALYRRRLLLSAVAQEEQRLDRRLQRLRQAERQHGRGDEDLVLDGVDGLARDADGEREVRLGEAACGAGVLQPVAEPPLAHPPCAAARSSSAKRSAATTTGAPTTG